MMHIVVGAVQTDRPVGGPHMVSCFMRMSPPCVAPYCPFLYPQGNSASIRFCIQPHLLWQPPLMRPINDPCDWHTIVERSLDSILSARCAFRSGSTTMTLRDPAMPVLLHNRAASEHQGHKGRQIHLGSFPVARPAAVKEYSM